jgi:hypothetical protein
MTDPWRNCAASIALVNEVGQRWPDRDKASDGTIGDAAHATRESDHNPWVKDLDGTGVVRARDIDKDGIDAAWLAEYLRQRGAAGDNRLTGGGYVIFNERITNPDFKAWREYTGTNPHTAHVHVSFSLDTAGYDSTAPWGIANPTNSKEEDIVASLADLERVINEAIDTRLGRVIWETTGGLPNRRGPDGSFLPGGPTNESLWGYTMNADGAAYRIEQKLSQLATGGVSPDELARELAPLLAPLIAQQLASGFAAAAQRPA